MSWVAFVFFGSVWMRAVRCRSCFGKIVLANRCDSDARSGSMGLGGKRLKAARMRLAGSTRWHARE